MFFCCFSCFWRTEVTKKTPPSQKNKTHQTLAIILPLHVLAAAVASMHSQKRWRLLIRLVRVVAPLQMHSQNKQYDYELRGCFFICIISCPEKWNHGLIAMEIQEGKKNMTKPGISWYEILFHLAATCWQLFFFYSQVAGDLGGIPCTSILQQKDQQSQTTHTLHRPSPTNHHRLWAHLGSHLRLFQLTTQPPKHQLKTSQESCGFSSPSLPIWCSALLSAASTSQKETVQSQQQKNLWHTHTHKWHKSITSNFPKITLIPWSILRCFLSKWFIQDYQDAKSLMSASPSWQTWCPAASPSLRSAAGRPGLSAKARCTEKSSPFSSYQMMEKSFEAKVTVEHTLFFFKEKWVVKNQHTFFTHVWFVDTLGQGTMRCTPTNVPLWEIPI